MQGSLALAALAASALAAAQVQAAGTVNTYSIDDPEYGSCRLKGVSTSSDNFKLYASVSGQDETLNSACARCVEVTSGASSVTAFVLDVCDGCASGEVQLSADALSALGLNSSTVGAAEADWDFVTCPENLLSGDVKACLMEGASYSYIPLEFYNSYKIISAVTIDGVNASSTDDSFLWYANSGNESSTWYKSIDVELTSADGETKSTTFAFSSTSGCATSDVQFSVASTADGVDGNTSSDASSGSSSAGLIGGIVGAVVVVLLIVASVIVYKRRRRASNDSDTPNDVEGGYLSPKKRAATGTAANEGDQSHHDQDGSIVEPRSPTMEYAESYTPAAAALHQPTDLDLDEDNRAVATESAATGAALSHGSSASSMASVPGARPSSHLSFGTNSPGSPAASHVSSAVESEQLSSRSGSRVLSAEPTFRFSSKNQYAAPNPQKLAYSQKPAPTLSAPVIPASMTANLQYDDEDDRGSFDVDDMRDTEEMKTNEPLEPSFDERSSRAYGAQSSYYAPESYSDSTVTSPQSYVRATSLRRNPSQRMANPSRSSSRYNNNSTMFSDASQPSTYGAPAQQAPAASYAYSSQPSHPEPAPSSYDPYGSQQAPGSFRESTGGYSRESLNILGYPYSKRSQRHMNN